MALCVNCRMALRLAVRHSRPLTRNMSSSASSHSPDFKEILSKPTWSVRSLLASPDAPPAEAITSSQLHHLLRLSALPLPKTEAEEKSMIATLQSQLHFVRAVQRVDTTGVKPLTAIRDETEQGLKEITIGLDDLRSALNNEKHEGYLQRPRRVKENIKPEEENWHPLATAPRTAPLESGPKDVPAYFVVESAKSSEQESG